MRRRQRLSPPQQTAAWTAPQTKLPKVFVSATAALFRQGLADPRGCRYCAIEVRLGSWRHEEILVSTHGWLIPALPRPRCGLPSAGTAACSP